MTAELNPEARLGWIWMINNIRRDLRMKDEENVKFIMEENEKLYWEVVHARWAHDYLEKELEAIGLKTVELVSSKEAYDAETRAYMAQEGNYSLPLYVEAEALCMLEGYLEWKYRDRPRSGAVILTSFGHRAGASEPDPTRRVTDDARRDTT